MEKIVDVIIPVYKPGQELNQLLERLHLQALLPREILLLNTEKQYFDAYLEKNPDFADKFPRVRVEHITKQEFDHGATRRMGADHTTAPVFVMMTQDAVPADTHLLSELTEPLFQALSEESDRAPGKNAPQEKVAEEKTLVEKTTEENASEEEGLAEDVLRKTALGENAPGKNAPGETVSEQKIVAVCYGRQLAESKSSVLEKFSRKFNYPEESRIKTIDDLPAMGIKTFFCSDVCAAYRRDLYVDCGGFVTKAIFNEDMIFANTAIKKGYAIGYRAKAKVYHSHNYSGMQQFHRNFDLGVSQAQHPEVFAGISSEAEGKKMVKEALSYLISKGKFLEIPRFFFQCFCKYAGYLLGKKYNKLPSRVVLLCTSNKEYWKEFHI